MGIYCVLCGKKDKSVSYIRFPSNEDIMRRKQWLKFCKKTEKYLYDSHRLCTDHFKPEDLRKRLKCIVVQPEAVPCIYRKTDGNISTGIMSNDSSNDNINVVNYSQSTTVTETMSKQKATIIAHNDVHPYHRMTVITHTSCYQITNSSCGTPRESQDFAKEDMSDAHCSNKRKCLEFHSTELVSNDGIDSTIPMHESPKKLKRSYVRCERSSACERSDEDVATDDSPPPRKTAGRARKPISYALKSDDSDDSD